MATKLATRVLPIFVLAFVQIVPAHAQCDLQISYLVRDLPSPVHGTLKLMHPDGKSTVLFSDTSRQGSICYRLEQKGEYRLSVSLADSSLNSESLEQRFSLTGEEHSVEASIHFQLEPKDISDWSRLDSIPSGHFLITKYSSPSPLVTIKYSHTSSGKEGEFPGPFFSVINESRDTLYGEWLPGYFWGTVSVWKDDGYTTLGATIDTNWEERPPLYPGAETLAWVGSFGRFIPFGRYRFNLYYSTEGSFKGSTRLLSETDSFRWWGTVENWHLLSCDFEVDSYFPVSSPTPNLLDPKP